MFGLETWRVNEHVLGIRIAPYTHDAMTRRLCFT
jgi:hypothetical protein